MPTKKSSNNKTSAEAKKKKPKASGRKKRQPSAAKKKTAKKRQTMQRDIKKAVEQLPDFVMNRPAKENDTHQMLTDFYTEKKPTKKTIIIPEKKDTRKQLLVVGVTTLAVTVFGLWAWNLRVMFSDVSHAQNKEAPLWAEATADFATVLETLTPPEESSPETPSKNIKNTIEETLAALFAAETASTTEHAAPSTDEIPPEVPAES
jgi:hypothetical protein